MPHPTPHRPTAEDLAAHAALGPLTDAGWEDCTCEGPHRADCDGEFRRPGCCFCGEPAPLRSITHPRFAFCADCLEIEAKEAA